MSKLEDKPGNCPPVVGPGPCIIVCRTDDDCKTNLKCCMTGCGGRTCQGKLKSSS